MIAQEVMALSCARGSSDWTSRKFHLRKSGEVLELAALAVQEKGRCGTEWHDIVVMVVMG